MKTKILNVYDKNGLSGVESVIRGIKKAKYNDIKLYFYCLRNIQNKRKDSKKFFYFNSRIKLNLLSFIKFKKIMNKNRINIIHSHQNKSFIYSVLFKKFNPKIKIIQHEHAAIFQNNFYTFFVNRYKNKVDLFIAISKATKQRLIEKAHINPKKIIVLYNFIDLNKFNKRNIVSNIQKERKKLSISKNDFVIGFAGRLIKRKGWEEFIETAKILEKDSQFKFLIAGDGRDREKMLRLIKKYKLQEKVTYLGYQQDMIKFYSLLNCFVMPSHWEPMGLTELEAQAMEVPVIASDIPGLNEVVNNEKDCLLVKPQNPKEISEKIRLIRENKLLREYLSKNSLKNTKEYSLDKYLKNLQEIYKYFKDEKN